jgi:hypothetical protein
MPFDVKEETRLLKNRFPGSIILPWPTQCFETFDLQSEEFLHWHWDITFIEALFHNVPPDERKDLKLYFDGLAKVTEYENFYETFYLHKSEITHFI